MKKIYVASVIIVAAIGIVWWMSLNDFNQNKPTEFYLISSDVDSSGVHEIFVLHNAPYDTSEIRKTIERFNLETLPVDSIRKYRVRGRTFYRESKYITRYFKEGEDYDPIFSNWDNVQDFRNHEDDILVIMSYYLDNSNGQVCYSYWQNWNYDYKKDDKYSNQVDVYFCNLDSFYKARKREYKIK